VRRAAYREAAEATLVALALAADVAAFEELVRRRQAWVRALLRRLGASPALADDLAQQVFLQAWTGLAGLRTPAAWAGWLRQIVVNAWRMHWRGAGPAMDSLDDPAGDAAAQAAAAAATHDDPSLALDLDRLLAALRPAERLCVVLAHAEGLSHGEIVALTGWPLGTVKSHVNRGTARLRAAWTPHPQEA
jgi:RNA polymerase sigma-70 factor (ECF subfamily)